jgi:NADH-quinone oxidoreductase subunit N
MESMWIVILPEMLLAAGGLLIFCAGAFWLRRPAKLLFSLALIFPLGAIAASAFAPMAGMTLSGMLDSEGYARLFSTLIASIAFITVLISFRYSRKRGFENDEYYGILLFATLGMDLVARASHWLVFFLGLELLSISLYVLIAIRKDDPFYGEAGLKYLITGAMASAFLAFGIGLWYAGFGSLGVSTGIAGFPESADVPIMLTALALILVGIGFKISLVPFHLWTPDVYQGSPAPVTAFLATGSKVAVLAFFIRLCFHLQDPLWSSFKAALWIVAFLTLVVGTITALNQSDLKRLLAYSSVAQMGYLIMTLLAVKLESGLFALAFYLIVYAAMDLGAFGAIASLSEEFKDRDALEEYQGLGFSHPWTSAVLSFSLLSLAGLPPTAGFLGKVLLFRAVLQAQVVSLAVIAIAMVVLSIYLYMKVVVSLYMRPAPVTAPLLPAVGFYEQLGGVLILLFLLWSGIAPSPLLSLISRILPAGM